MNLNKSVAEVLEALDRAKAHVPQDWEYLSNDENVMSQVMEMEYMPKPLGDHLGVSKELFPASTLLEDDEIKIIVEKILDVWAVYHYLADLPEGLPIRIAYETLLSVWDETVSCFPVGNFHFDFYEMELEQYVNHKIGEVRNFEL
jgi:hypothetical protein